MHAHRHPPKHAHGELNGEHVKQQCTAEMTPSTRPDYSSYVPKGAILDKHGNIGAWWGRNEGRKEAKIAKPASHIFLRLHNIKIHKDISMRLV